MYTHQHVGGSRYRVAARITPSLTLSLMLFFFFDLPMSVFARPETAPHGVTKANPGTITLEEFTSGLNEPVAIADAGDGSNRLFVVEQAGFVRIIRDGLLEATPFLDISSRTTSGWETGMLSLAFHPNYAANGYLYVYYTTFAQGFRTEVARYTVSNHPDLVDPESRVLVYAIPQPGGHHNGGTLAFGPHDGYLYLSTGDGMGDPSIRKSSMDLDSPLGKILRFDVSDSLSSEQPYAIPPTNPFIHHPEALPEVWALGLRNPWRISFDSANGDLYIGDVGEAKREEINYQAVDEPFGQNYGWTCLEGTLPFNTGDPLCTDPDSIGKMKLPIAEHERRDAYSITGGHVYRGRNYAFLQGRYFYADFGTGRIWSMTRDSGIWQTPRQEADTSMAIATFGQDQQGEIYLADYHEGVIYHIVDATGISADVTLSTFDSSTPVGIEVGEIAPFEVTIRNRNAASTALVTATVTLPAGLAYVTATLSANAGEVSVSDGDAPQVIQWRGTFSVVNSAHIHYQVRASGAVTGVLTSILQIIGENIRPFEIKRSIYVPKETFAMLHLPLLQNELKAIVYLPLVEHRLPLSR